MSSPIFKIGQQVYNSITLEPGVVSEIEIDSSGNYILTVNVNLSSGSTESLKKGAQSEFISDKNKVIELLREMVEEYKEAFFREKALNQKTCSRVISRN